MVKGGPAVLLGISAPTAICEIKRAATGNFSTKQKVKKTYFYRASVSENASCDDELSNTQKVRVQKKKAAQEA